MNNQGIIRNIKMGLNIRLDIIISSLNPYKVITVVAFMITTDCHFSV